MPDHTVKLARLAVDTKIFPLIEIENGKMKITRQPREDADLKEYFKIQGRFGLVKDKDIKEWESAINANWEEIQKKEHNHCLRKEN